MSARRTVRCRACGCHWQHEADNPDDADTWAAIHRLVHPDHELDILPSVSLEEACDLPDTSRLTWCAICAEQSCGWEMRARTEAAAQDFRAVHLRGHPSHQVAGVKF